MRRCVLLCLLVFLGCAAREQPRPVVPSVQAAAETWIHVSKTRRVLSVYEGSRLLKQYPVVLGRDPYWAKLYEGDRRTPEGDYRIVNKYPHKYWSRFMLLDYPTDRNREIYTWSRERDLIPVRNGEAAGIGGAVGIHGTEDESLNREGVDWTLGCISLHNRDVDELYELVPLGTRVHIER